MKVCLLSRFFDLRNGGVGRYSMELLKRLQREKDLEIKTVDQEDGIPLGEGMAKYLLFSFFESRFRIPSADVYHALSPLEALHAPAPLLTTFHDLIPILNPGKVTGNHFGSVLERTIRSNYFKMACSRAIDKSDLLASVSRQTKEQLVEEFGVDEQKIEVIRHGINPNLEPEHKKEEIFRIGTLSFLGPRKRIDLLIKSFLEADVDGELTIAGSGRMIKELKRVADGDNRVKFLGFVPEEEVKDFYNSLDVFVFPTKFEGYGLPIVEAMACKVPVVTLSDAIIPSDIKEKTIVTDDLRSWLKNPSFSEINLDENYEFAEKHDWEKCAKKHRDIYEKLRK